MQLPRDITLSATRHLWKMKIELHTVYTSATVAQGTSCNKIPNSRGAQEGISGFTPARQINMHGQDTLYAVKYFHQI